MVNNDQPFSQPDKHNEPEKTHDQQSVHQTSVNHNNHNHPNEDEIKDLFVEN